MLSTDSSPDDVRENYLLESLDQETELTQQNTPPPSASGVSLASSPGANQVEAKYQVHYTYCFLKIIIALNELVLKYTFISILKL